MNSALRLAKLLHKAQASKEQKALDAFKDVFEVSGCIDVTAKLRICEAQTSVLEEKAHKNLIVYLRTLFSCTNLNRNIVNERNNIPHYIMALESIGAYMEKEIIDSKNLTELTELLQEMRESIKNSTSPQHYKDILNSYVNELFMGIADIEFGGVKAFVSHAEIANGKVVLYNKAFKSSEIVDITNKIYAVSTKILSDGQTWLGAIGFVSGKLLG